MWTIGVILLAALLAVAYPTVRGNAQLDTTFSGLPKGVQAALGLGGGTSLTSPVGYLDSQYFANVLPAVLLVFSIGLAAWTISGDEQDGSLELLLANPVSRVSAAIARACGLIVLLGMLGFVSGATLVVLLPVAGLDNGLGAGHVWAATLAATLLALAFASVTFCLGAATGRKTLAVATTATLAVTGLVIEGIAAQVPVLRGVRALSPWHWMLGADPLGNGLSWQSSLLPAVVSISLIAVGCAVFSRRDLR
jgi:ABC-2 type transport system permease protein